MRQFVVIGHDAPTDPEFSLDDLPGAGRMDVLARCVTSAFVLSHAIREDVRVHLVLADSYTVRFDGAQLRGLNPDERSTAARIRDALAVRDEAIGAVPATPSPGVSLSPRGVEDTLDTVGETGRLVQLHPDGDPAVELEPPANPAFVLSDHRPFGEVESALLADRETTRVSLGPRALHADHAITVAHNWLDTAGFTVY